MSLKTVICYLWNNACDYLLVKVTRRHQNSTAT